MEVRNSSYQVWVLQVVSWQQLHGSSGEGFLAYCLTLFLEGVMLLDLGYKFTLNPTNEHITSVQTVFQKLTKFSPAFPKSIAGKSSVLRLWL